MRLHDLDLQRLLQPKSQVFEKVNFVVILMLIIKHCQLLHPCLNHRPHLYVPRHILNPLLRLRATTPLIIAVLTLSGRRRVTRMRRSRRGHRIALQPVHQLLVFRNCIIYFDGYDGQHLQLQL